MADQVRFALIQFEGIGTEGYAQDLNDWLTNQQFPVEKTRVSMADESGTRQSILAVVLVLLGTPAGVKVAEKVGDAVVKGVEKLGDALIAWIKARRPSTSITVRVGSKEVTVQTNSANLDKIRGDLKALLSS